MDNFTSEIIKDALVAVGEEMFDAMIRTSMSPIIYETTDFGVEAFHAAHYKQFTYRLDNEVQIVNYHLVCTVEVDKPELARRSATGRTASDALLGTRQVDFDRHGIHEMLRCRQRYPVRHLNQPGNRF